MQPVGPPCGTSSVSPLLEAFTTTKVFEYIFAIFDERNVHVKGTRLGYRGEKEKSPIYIIVMIHDFVKLRFSLKHLRRCLKFL